jgi:hypothetical protein
MFVPFFSAATVIGLALITKPEESPRLYFYNLTGSAAGALVAVGLLEIAPVEHVVLALAGVAQGAAVFALLDAVKVHTASRARLLAAFAVLAMLGTTLYFTARPPVMRLSQYKGFSYALTFLGHACWPRAPVPLAESMWLRVLPFATHLDSLSSHHEMPGFRRNWVSSWMRKAPVPSPPSTATPARSDISTG